MTIVEIVSLGSKPDERTQGAHKQNGEVRGRVTKMNAGVRDPNRVNIFIDDKFFCSLDTAQVVELHLKIGQVLDATRQAELLAASEFGKVYQRTLEWCLTRPHSVREARDYLYRRRLRRGQLNRQREREAKKPLPTVSAATEDLVLQRLIERGYLDDQKFARFYIENRFLNKGVSQKRLRTELRSKGLDAETIEAALAEIPRDEDTEMQKMIAKKRAKYDEQKLLAYLVRQGFDYQAAKAAIERMGESEQEESEQHG